MSLLEKKAPEFCLPNQDDVEICLRDLKGKWIVLYFYPRDNTPGCTTEACEFTEAAPDFSDLDAIILGVSADSTKKHLVNNKHKKMARATFTGIVLTSLSGIWVYLLLFVY